MRVLLSGVIISLGLTSLLAQAQQSPVSDTKVQTMVEALRKAAPPQSPNDGMYSEWQVMPGAIASWSRVYLKKTVSPAEFENSPVTARGIVTAAVRDELGKQMRATKNETTAVRRTACWWMTGNTTGCDSGQTGAYVKKVVGFYQAQGSQPETSEPAPEGTTEPATEPATEPTTAPEPAPTPTPSRSRPPRGGTR